MAQGTFKSVSTFVIAAGLLVAMIVSGGLGVKAAGSSEAYLAAVADGIGAIPYRIGRWIGADVEAQAPAVRLLKPNKLLQRRFMSDSGEEGFSLLVVHCSDVRDMQGHYPPMCYPASGWTLDATTPADFAMGAISTPCRIYSLSRLRDGAEQQMTILNFFVVPSQTESLAPDMGALNRAAASLTRSGLGAAQVQLIMAGDVAPDRILKLMEEIAPSLEPAIWKVVNADR